MVKDILERNIEGIFKKAGFKTVTNSKIKGYEVDVLAVFDKNFKIVIECKQRSGKGFTVRNLVHEWESKNKEIKADKVVLALYGINIQVQDYELAKKHGITILSSKDIDKLLDMDDGNAIQQRIIRLLKIPAKSKNDDYMTLCNELLKRDETIQQFINYVKTRASPHFGRCMELMCVNSWNEAVNIEIVHKNKVDDSINSFEYCLSKHNQTDNVIPIILVCQFGINYDIIKIAEHFGVKYLICYDIKSGWLSEPIDRNKTKIKIITLQELKHMLKK